MDELEGLLGSSSGGVILEHHSSSFFPERWFDLVVILRADNTVLYDRLAKRGYSGKKIEENVEAEIMRVAADEATESYPSCVVVELSSDTVEDLEQNLGRVQAWVEQWKKDNNHGTSSSSSGGGSSSAALHGPASAGGGGGGGR